MTVQLIGPKGMSFNRDEEGHRNYEVTFQVRTRWTSGTTHDGPAYILNNWPLFAVGSPYVLTSLWPESTESDLWAFCTPEMAIKPHPDTKEGDPCQDWLITQHWSTKQSWRCQTNPIENPLLEPYEMRGGFSHEQIETRFDKDGNPLVMPNWQPIQGPMAEVKYSFPNISFAFNSATLPLSTYVNLINKVNDSVLWDLPARTIRFIDANWERKVYGSCFYYFRTTYFFEFNTDTFDKEIPAFGTMVRKTGGNHLNPTHFIPYKTQDENAGVMLNQFGDPVTRAEDQYKFSPKIAKEGNLLLLGIPSSLA